MCLVSLTNPMADFVVTLPYTSKVVDSIRPTLEIRLGKISNTYKYTHTYYICNSSVV